LVSVIKCRSKLKLSKSSSWTRKLRDKYITHSNIQVVIIENHFVPLGCKILLIALVIVKITLYKYGPRKR